MYLANRMVEQNGGQVDTSNPSEARHRVPPAVSGSYHETAAYFGDIVQQATHSALQAALLTDD